ncbi:hypothetical protein ABT56_15320 [Photobacterium aquae]|uniref:Type IV pilin n=1 Tax=Photobacterium aquae TaxID=1195763 RepID=A0A0J1GXW3_9GAMM|nr:prepilin-type N-terminal cleavage/methylation domain-containing protein [Photobacterium aquae]KLV04496.1 hypothetical protein ABT56_15320 [Photobacterium aquae]
MHSWKVNQGLTLIELITVISIIAVISAFAIPSFEKSRNAAEITSKSEIIYEFIRLAKYEAVKRNTTVEVFFEKNTRDTFCFGMRKKNSSDTCDQSSSAYPRTILDKNSHYFLKTADVNGGLKDLSVGTLLDFNPVTGQASNSKRILVNSSLDANLLKGVRVTDIGFVYRCSSATSSGEETCV